MKGVYTEKGYIEEHFCITKHATCGYPVMGSVHYVLPFIVRRKKRYKRHERLSFRYLFLELRLLPPPVKQRKKKTKKKNNTTSSGERGQPA